MKERLLINRSALRTVRERSCYILDLDGVVYTGTAPIPGAVEAISHLRKMGKKIAFLTNNSSRSPQDIQIKLQNLGVSCDSNEIMSSGYAVIQYLRGQTSFSPILQVFVIGTPSLKNSLQREGLILTTPDACDAVIVGFDPNFNYENVSTGLRALLRNIPFIVCNRDPYFPIESGELLPGCGAMVGSLMGASLREPNVIIGKPNTFMLNALINNLGWSLSDCVMIGDSLESDIAMAINADIPSVFLKGKLDDHLSLSPHLKPTLQVSDLAQLSELIAQDY